MKKKHILIFLLLFSFKITYSQEIKTSNYNTDTINIIKWNNIDNIIRYSIEEYIDKVSINDNKGIIVIKFLKLEQNSFVYSISYYYNDNDIYLYKPTSNYFYIKDRLVLIRNAETVEEEQSLNLLDKHLKYSVYNDKIIDKNIKWLCVDCFVSRDMYYVGVVKYRNNDLSIKLYPNYQVPDKYKVENYFLNIDRK